MKLSFLDIRGILGHALELAPLAETLGYERFWITEHQPQPTPLLYATLLAGVTERIRVGTAGILFHYYAPMRVAHDFHLLERAYEGRIDAGFCGAISTLTDPVELDGASLQRRVEDYPARVARLVRHLRNVPGNPAYHRDSAWSGCTDQPPELWSLGGGSRSADLAAEHGLCFGYSLLFANNVDDPSAVQRYRDRFVPAFGQPEPRAIVAIGGVCAETDEHARDLASPMHHKFFQPRVVGSARTCREQLAELAHRYRVDEIVFADAAETLEARKRSCEVLIRG